MQATTPGPSPTVEKRREWELELVEASTELPDTAEPVLRHASARPSTAAS